jgi:cation diffusion facilitator family transporter
MRFSSGSDEGGHRALRTRAARLALASGVLICAGKFAAFGITGSSAVLSDAAESIVNVAAAALLLYSIALAALPADRNHPYGHGKVEFFSVGVEGTLIVIAGLLVLAEALHALWTGPEVRRVGTGLWILASVTVLNGALGSYLIRVGTQTHSLALVADGRHLMTDVLTSAGVLTGLGAVALTGWVVLDPLVAIGVASHILHAGWKLLREGIRGLMDEADPDTLQRIVEAVERRREPWYIDVHSLRAWRSGRDQHADLHLVVPRYFDAEQLHDIHDAVIRVVLSSIRAPGDAIVHFDPCRPRQCPGCEMRDCRVREAPFSGREPLTLDGATREDETLDTGTPVSEIGL